MEREVGEDGSRAQSNSEKVEPTHDRAGSRTAPPHLAGSLLSIDDAVAELCFRSGLDGDPCFLMLGASFLRSECFLSVF